MLRQDVERALAAWREAERKLATAAHGSPDWRAARAQEVSARERYFALTARAPLPDEVVERDRTLHGGLI
jgi:hypothetical protein